MVNGSFLRIVMTVALVLFVRGCCLAQVYEADYLIGNYIRCEKTDDDGTKWIVKIPNGTKINVDRRVVAADSTDCRDVKASFSYNGDVYTTEARWLRFSDDNPEGTADVFASDDFSPTEDFVKDRLAFTRFNPLSPTGRVLYGVTLPITEFVLMIIAVLLLFRRTTVRSAVPFVIAVAIQIYTSIMLGDDVLWWCLPEYQGVGGAIAGFVFLALYLTLELTYIIGLWAMRGVKIWPVFAMVLLLYPAIVISFFVTGGMWAGVGIVCLFPFLVNCSAGGKGAVGPTLLMMIGAAGFNVTLGAAYYAGMKILASIIIVCPLAAVLVALYVKNKAGFHIYRSNGEWVTPWGTYPTLEAAKRAAPRK